jgi:hypothetical protein
MAFLVFVGLIWLAFRVCAEVPPPHDPMLPEPPYSQMRGSR